MRVVKAPPPAEYVQPRLSQAAMDRMWLAIEQAQPARPMLRRWQVQLAAAAAVAAVGVALWRPWQETALQVAPEKVASAERWFATGAEGKSVRLEDGSVLQLGHTTQLRIVRESPRETRVLLERGTATCDVELGSERRFVIEAGSFAVTARDSRFTAGLDADPKLLPVLSLQVERGSIELRGEHGSATLGAGQKWSSGQLLPPKTAPSTVPTLRTPPTVTHGRAGPTPPPKLEEQRAPDREARTAADLMRDANQARLAGRAREAAQHYDTLRKQHPGDARAGLAAFELARLRLHSLGDAAGALEAFDFALQRGKGFFAEDAEAGRVEALSRLGNMQACRDARRSFLRRFPKSPQRPRVRALCPTP